MSKKKRVIEGAGRLLTDNILFSNLEGLLKCLLPAASIVNPTVGIFALIAWLGLQIKDAQDDKQKEGIIQQTLERLLSDTEITKKKLEQILGEQTLIQFDSSIDHNQIIQRLKQAQSVLYSSKGQLDSIESKQDGLEKLVKEIKSIIEKPAFKERLKTIPKVWPEKSYSGSGPKFIDVFVGRIVEKGQLDDAIVSAVPIVAIIGLMGQGKSSLLANWFKEKTPLPAQTGLFWRRIYDDGFGFHLFIDHLYEYLTGQAMDRIQYPNVADRIAMVFSYLKQKPTWIVLDGAERWLRLWAYGDKEADGVGASRQDREGSEEGLDDFLRGFGVLADGCRLFLTTRALPSALDESQVYAIGSSEKRKTEKDRRLKDLTEKEAVVLLQHFAPDTSESLLKTIAKTYGYHPYTIHLLGMLIADDSGGLDHWQELTPLEGTKLDGLLAKLCEKFAGDLPLLELIACSVGAVPVEMAGDLLKQDVKILRRHLQKLHQWQLVEYSGSDNMEEHAIIRRYLLDWMDKVGVQSRQIKMGRWWMGQMIPDWPQTLAQVQPRLKAFEYAIEIEDGETAAYILFRKVSEKCHQETLSEWLGMFGYLDESVNYHTKIGGLLTKLCKDNSQLRNWLATAYTSRGNAFSELGQLYMAVADYGEALKLYRELMETEKRWELRHALAWVYNNRGNAYNDLGQLHIAVDDYGEALKLRKELVETEGRQELRNDLAVIYSNRGVAFRQLGQLDKAVTDSRDALILYRELVENEGRLELRSDLAMAYNNGGSAYLAMGQLDKAVVDYSEATKIYRELVETKGRRELSRDLSGVYNNRAIVFKNLGQLDKAAADYSEAMKIFRKLVEMEGRRELRNDLASVYNNRGIVCKDLGQLDKAVNDYDEALKIRKELVETEGRRELRNDLASVYNNRGNGYRDFGQLDKAVSDYDEALELRKELVETEGRRELRDDLAMTLGNRAMTYQKMQEWGKAREDYLKAVGLFGEMIRERVGHVIDFFALCLGWGCQWMGQIDVREETIEGVKLAMGEIEQVYQKIEKGTEQSKDIIGFLEAVMQYQPELNKSGAQVDSKRVEEMLKFLKKG